MPNPAHARHGMDPEKAVACNEKHQAQAVDQNPNVVDGQAGHVDHQVCHGGRGPAMMMSPATAGKPLVFSARYIEELGYAVVDQADQDQDAMGVDCLEHCDPLAAESCTVDGKHAQQGANEDSQLDEDYQLSHSFLCLGTASGAGFNAPDSWEMHAQRGP